MRPAQPSDFDQLSDYHHNRWRIVIDPKLTAPTDVYKPEFWVNGTKKLRVRDVITVIAKDDSFQFEVKVMGKPETGNGLVVELAERFPAGMTAAQFHAAGLAARSTLSTSTVAGKPVPRVEHTEAEGWRVIDLKGEVASKGHRNEAAANVAMSKYLSQLGIDKVAEPKAAAVGSRQ